jgi:protein-tyrosine phosphatase
MDSTEEAPGIKQSLKKFVPRGLLRERDTYLRLGAAGSEYFRLRVADIAGLRAENERRAPIGSRSFVFVCFGNIMRSPMAEALFHRTVAAADLKGITATSAGIHATPGTAAHPWSLQAAPDFGVSLGDHRSRLLTPEIVAKSDAIFVMDFQNKAEMVTLFPESRERVRLLSAYSPGPLHGREIRDPFYADVQGTRECYRTIQECIQNLVQELDSGSSRQQNASELAAPARSGLS